MPLPLLLIPIAAAAASGVSIGTLIGSIFGALTGGFVLGGGTLYLYNELQNEPEPSEEHEESRRIQATMTRERMDETQNQVKSVHAKLNSVAKAAEDASNTTAQSTQELKSVTSELKEISTAFVTGTKIAKETSNHLMSTSDAIKATTKETINLTQENTVRLNELDNCLKLKEKELHKAREDMSLLQSALDAQIKTSAQLEDIVITVNGENTELKKSFTKQQKIIETVEPQVKRLAEQMRFFKQAARQSMPKEELQPDNTSFI